MKKSLILAFISILLSTNNTYAQTQKLWEKSITNEEINQDVYDSAVDSDGNIYLTGLFSRKYYVENTAQVSTEGAQDSYIAKYDPLGNFLWVKRFGTPNSIYPQGDLIKNRKIKISGKNIYIVGSFFQKINFSTPLVSGSNELISEGNYDIFLAKFDTDGNFKWAKRAGGDDSDFGMGLCVSNGFIYVTGSFKKTANFNTPSSTNSSTLISASPNNSNTFIAKYSESGSLIWIKRAGTNLINSGIDIDINETGIYVLGDYTLKMSFSNIYDPNADSDLVASPGSSTQIYLAKFDLEGNYLWSRRAGGFYWDNALALTVNSKGIFFMGNHLNFNNNSTFIDFNNPPDISQNTLFNHGSECFLAKFNDDGEFQWAKRVGIPSSERIKLASGNDDIYVHAVVNKVSLSQSTNSLNLNFSTPFVAGQNEISMSEYSTDESIIVKFNGTTGNFIWAKRAGGGQLGIPPPVGGETKRNYNYCSISVKSNGSLIISGTFGGTANFNTPSNFSSNTLSSPVKGNIFLAQFTSNGIYQWAKKHTDIVSITPEYEVFENSAKKCASDANGNLYVLGTFKGIFSENNQLIVANSKEMHLVKYNKDGEMQWLKRAGGLEDIFVYDIGLMDGDIFVTGAFKGTINFNTPSLSGSNEISSAGDFDVFIAKYNTDGTFKWAKRAGGSGPDSGYGIAINSNSVFLVGEFSSSANFNTPSSLSNNVINSDGESDIFVANYTRANGTIQWLKRAGGTLSDIGLDIAIDNSSIYITGRFNSETINFNTPSNSTSNTLITTSDEYISIAGFLAKFSLSGNFLWARRFGGDEFAKGTSVAVRDANVYVGGSYFQEMTFSQTTSFSSGAASNLKSGSGLLGLYFEGFLVKYNSSGTLQWYKRSGGEINDLAVSEDGNSLYTIGGFNGTWVNFNTPSDFSSNTLELDYEQYSFELAMFFAKYSCDNGNFIWAKKNDIDPDIEVYADIGRGITISGSRLFMVGQRIPIEAAGSSAMHYCFFEGSITTNALSGSSFCAGTNISVPFSTSGIFDAGNSFKVELSNASGVFPAKNGYIGTGTTSPITSGLPTNASGTNYKVRVVSTNPIVIGSATPFLGNGFDIIAPSDGGTVTGGTTVCTGTNSITLTLNNKVGNVLYWQGAVNPAFNSSVATFNSTATSLTLTDRTVGAYYRAVVQNGPCALDYSTSAQVAVSPTTVAGTLSSVNGIFCAGTNNNTINLTGKVGNVLKWQSSSSSAFTSPVDINNTSTGLNVTNINATTYYRAVVKSGACAEANTANRQITISTGAVTLTNSIPLNSVTYPVKSNFTITGQNAVTGSSNVLYRSNKAVELKPGFRAENGTVFKAEIGGCN